MRDYCGFAAELHTCCIHTYVESSFENFFCDCTASHIHCFQVNSMQCVSYCQNKCLMYVLPLYFSHTCLSVLPVGYREFSDCCVTAGGSGRVCIIQT